MTSLRLALGYQSRVGKDTFADAICKEFGGIKIAIAEDLYEACGLLQTYLKVEVKKEPKLLQDIGMLARNLYGERIWIDRAMEKIAKAVAEDPNVNIVISDIRLENEMEILKNVGFTTIRIIRDNRIIDRDPNHISEISLANASFDHTIYNNGERRELEQTAILFGNSYTSQRLQSTG